MEKSVAVLGGGVMGLATAYLLSKHGFKVTVFEKEKELGGQLASVKVNGQLVDRFYHYLFQDDLQVFLLLEDLGVNPASELTFEPIKQGLYKDNHLYSFNGLFDLFDLNTSIKSKLGYLKTLAKIKYLPLCAKHYDRRTAFDFLTRKISPEQYNYFWKFLLEKKYGDIYQDISLLHVFTRVKKALVNKSLTTNLEFGYFTYGCDRLVNLLCSALIKNNGNILKDCEVISLKQLKHSSYDKFIVQTKDNQLLFDGVVSTLPLEVLSSIVKPLKLTDYAKIASIKSMGCVCVAAAYKFPVTNNFWNNLDLSDCISPGLIEYSNLKPMSFSLCYMPFYLTKDSNLWHYNDDFFIEQLNTLVKRLSPQNSLLDFKISRYSYAQPYFTYDVSRKIPSMDTGIKNFYLADTTFAYPQDRSMDRSIYLAHKLADKLTKDLSDKI